MSDLIQNAALVNLVSGVPQSGVSGEPITAGQPVYFNATNPQAYYRAFNNGSALQSGYDGSKTVVFIALNSCPGAGQPLTVARSGLITLGANLVKGNAYYVSNNIGAIFTTTDLNNTMYVTLLGIALDTNNMATPPLTMFATGVIHG